MELHRIDPERVALEHEQMPEPDAEVQARFDAVNQLLEGLTPAEMLRAGRGFYLDADRMPQWRGGRIRAVPTEGD